jgi:hypothetical protein
MSVTPVVGSYVKFFVEYERHDKQIKKIEIGIGIIKGKLKNKYAIDVITRCYNT